MLFTVVRSLSVLLLISILPSFSAHALECVVDAVDLLDIKRDIPVRPLRAAKAVDALLARCQSPFPPSSPVVVGTFNGSSYIETPFPRAHCNPLEQEQAKQAARENALFRCTSAGHLRCEVRASSIRVNGTFVVSNFTKQGCLADAVAQAIEFQ